MNENEQMKDLIKNSNEEIARNYLKNGGLKLDEELKKEYSPEKWEVYVSLNSGNQEDENKVIEKIGEKKYNALVDEIINDFRKKIDK